MNLDEHIYSIKDIDVLLEEVKFIKNNKQVEYANIPCVIDIETSSFYEDGNKRAIMYAFVFGINGKCIIGRTYDELIDLLTRTSEFYGLHKKRRMIFYVHNLAFEFQFFRKWLSWEDVFGIEERKVVYALMNIGIELRCSYVLSGYSLDHVGKNLTKYKVKKKVGDLDYSKIRHSKTLLDNKELGYILNDGLVVMAYIQEEIEQHHDNICYIPLTKTGKVRDYVRKMCLYGGKHHGDKVKFLKYHQLMMNLQIASLQEYMQLKRAFSGGFTHANSLFVGKVVDDVTSYDFTSSYPAVMIMEQYPMGEGHLEEVHSKEELLHYFDIYCCLVDITFINIESKVIFEHYISESKCSNLIHPRTDNGRIVEADELTITITEQDYFIIEKMYTWSRMKIKNLRCYHKGYLPHNFVYSILKLYEKKTTLKGVEDMIVEYMQSKENINACYGMCVTDICRENLEYNDIIDYEEHGGWNTTECDYQKSIEKYNKSKRRFLSFAWGVWVTAYARRNLFSGILECKADYIYADTDSVKIRNVNRHKDYFKRYNDVVIRKLQRAMEYHGLSMDLVEPKTIKGEKKTLGVWDYDGHYQKFKTLGAKRYMVKVDDPIKYGDELIPYSLTISGLSKFVAIPYLYHKYGDGILDAFDDGMFIPRDYTGKMIHTYIDFEQSGYVKDYNGVICKYEERSSIHLENCEYELSLASDFVDFLKGLEEHEE